MAVRKKQRLADYGLNSERLLMPKKGPGVFEEELGELLTFVAILGVAYVYIWRKGALNWH